MTRSSVTPLPWVFLSYDDEGHDVITPLALWNEDREPTLEKILGRILGATRRAWKKTAGTT